MPDNNSLKAEAALQVALGRWLMLDRTLEAADRMVAALASLHAQFPSDELREALLSTTDLRDRLRDWLDGEAA